MRTHELFGTGRWCALAACVVTITAATATGQGLEREQIVPSVGTASMQFGISTASDGDVLVVGAAYDDTTPWDAGSAYVYRRDAATGAWNLEQQLFPSDPESNSLFGIAVAVSGDALVVGASYEDNAKGTDAGSAYVFRYNATTHVWAQEQKLTAGLGSDYDHFGAAVAIDGNVLLVGAPHADTAAGVDAGAAYVYRWQNSIVKWIEEKRLVDSAALPSNVMGWSVALDGDRAFVGSPYADLAWPNYDAGTVLTYTYAGGIWTQGQTLTAASPAGYDEFGYSIAVSGDELAIGAPFVDAAGPVYNSGAAFVFHWDGATWVQEWMVVPPRPTNDQVFGNAIAIDGDLLVVGAANDEPFGRVNGGSAWTARHGRKGWVLDQQLAASDDASYDLFGVALTITADAVVIGANGKDTAYGGDWGGAYVYPRAVMNLEIEPSSPPPKTEVAFSAFYGDPGEFCLITLEDADGTPIFMPVLLYKFAADHALNFTLTTPDQHYGVAVGFRSYRVGPLGNVVRSDLAYLNL